MIVFSRRGNSAAFTNPLRWKGSTGSQSGVYSQPPESQKVNSGYAAVSTIWLCESVSLDGKLSGLRPAFQRKGAVS